LIFDEDTHKNMLAPFSWPTAYMYCHSMPADTELLSLPERPLQAVVD